MAEQLVAVEQLVARLLDIHHDTWQGADNFFAAVLTPEHIYIHPIMYWIG